MAIYPIIWKEMTTGIFTFGRLLELAMDGCFRLLHHSMGIFMVSNNFFCMPNSFDTMAVYTDACIEIKPIFWHLRVKGLKHFL